MSQENLRKMAHPFLALYNADLISIRKWGNEQTDRHTRNLELFGASVHTSEEGAGVNSSELSVGGGGWENVPKII